MRHSVRQTFGLLASLAAVCAVLLSFKVEENLNINPDGTETHSARISIENQFGDAMQETPVDSEKHGFAVVDEGETADDRYLDTSREFKEVSELNNDDHPSLVIDRPTAFKNVRAFRPVARVKAVTLCTIRCAFLLSRGQNRSSPSLSSTPTPSRGESP